LHAASSCFEACIFSWLYFGHIVLQCSKCCCQIHSCFAAAVPASWMSWSQLWCNWWLTPCSGEVWPIQKLQALSVYHLWVPKSKHIFTVLADRQGRDTKTRNECMTEDVRLQEGGHAGAGILVGWDLGDYLTWLESTDRILIVDYEVIGQMKLQMVSPKIWKGENGERGCEPLK
jgi:hypothetical protein